MFTYVGLFTFVLFSAIRMPSDDKSPSYQLHFFSFIAFIVLFGLRYQVGADYQSYIDIYEDIGNNNVSRGIEFGYVLANRTLNILNLPPQSIIFVSFAATFAMLYNGAKRWSSNMSLSLMIMLGFGLVFSTTNLIRQSLAFGICVLSLKPINDRKLSRFLLLIGLAMLFHRSVILFVPAFWLSRWRVPVPVWISFTVIAILINLYSSTILDTFLDGLGQSFPFYSHYVLRRTGFDKTATRDTARFENLA